MRKFVILIAISLSTVPAWLLAHGNKKHSQNATVISPILLDQINRSLQGSPLNSLTKACFDCHSHETKFPWYYKIPGIKGMIDNDIKEAKEHLVLGNSFPFKGSGDPIADLEEMLEEIEEEKMPLLLYSVFHPDSRLNGEEKQELLLWIKESINLLKNLSN